MEEQLARLTARRVEVWSARCAITDKVAGEGRDQLSVAESAEFDELTARLAAIDAEITEAREHIARSGHGNPGAALAANAQARVDPAGASRGGWAARAATALQQMGGSEGRSIASGSVDLPTLVSPTVTPLPRPERLLDLIVSRAQIESNAFEYFRATVRDTKATVVKDAAEKPTSVYTMEAVEDRARVIAHLSEPVPIRLFADHRSIEDWLRSEMVEGILDSLETQIISGSGAGENMRGILKVAGTTSVAFTVDAATTIRRAQTVMQQASEHPQALVLSPPDAEALDLSREGSDGAFLLGGYQGGGNVYPGAQVQRVVSNSVPEGTALLADWSQLRLFVRESVRLDVDAGGDLFSSNQCRLRCEGRFGVGVLRPSAFAVVSLTNTAG